MEKSYSDEEQYTSDVFLISVIDYVKQLASIPEFITLFERVEKLGASTAAKRLLTLTEMMENGQVKEEGESKVELEMICCSLAIDGFCKMKLKKLTPNMEQESEISHGRSR